MPGIIYLGAQVRIDAEFTNASTGERADPTTVTVTVQRPDGTDDTVPATHDGTGLYHATYDTESKSAGIYRVRFDGSGALDAVVEGMFEVLPSGVV